MAPDYHDNRRLPNIIPPSRNLVVAVKYSTRLRMREAVIKGVDRIDTVRKEPRGLSILIHSGNGPAASAMLYPAGSAHAVIHNML